MLKEKLNIFSEKVRVGATKAVNSFASTVVKQRLWFVIAFAVLLIGGIVGFIFVNTNYDSTKYLPADSEVNQGLSVMYDEFGDGGNASLMLEKKENEGGFLYSEARAFKEKIVAIDGVKNAMWLDDLFVGITGDFTDEYSQDEYAESFLLLLRLTKKINLTELSENQTINAILNNMDLSNIGENEIKSLMDLLFATVVKEEYQQEIKSGNYSFDEKKGKQIIISAVQQLVNSDAVTGIDISEMEVNDVQTMLDGFSSSLSMFFASDESGNYLPLYQIAFSGTDYAKSTMNAIDKIRAEGEKESFSVHMSGNSATTYNSIDCVERQTLYALIAVGVVVLIILFLFSTSFWEPILYLITIGVAVVINMGTNVIMGSVSYLTSGVAGILQLALSMDYSIFLLTRFKQEKEKTADAEEAMINAIKASISPISSSSLTTIASFVAIMFMSYTIGLDMGIVFAKGVIFSLLSVFLILPGLAIYTNKLIVKTEHKAFKFTFRKFTGGILKARKIIPIACLALIIVSAVGQNYMQFGYGDTATFGSEGSLIYEDKQAIESVFGSQNQLAVLIKKDVALKEVTLSDGTETNIESIITNELYSKEYIDTAQSKSVILSSGMDKLLPESFLKQFDNGGEYLRIISYLDLPEEGENTEKAISEIRTIFDKNGVKDDEYFLLGGSSSALEIKEIVNKDYTVITWVNILFVAVILLITFRNAILPFILVFVIQGSVWISMSISVLTGDSLVFLGYLIVSSVMLGATIDYGILLTSNYLEARKSFDRIEAGKNAVSKSSRAILTSSLILCCAGTVIALTSTMPAIVVFGELIARCSLASLILVFILLPCLLVLCDKLINKTTLGKADFFIPTQKIEDKEKEAENEDLVAVTEMEDENKVITDKEGNE